MHAWFLSTLSAHPQDIPLLLAAERGSGFHPITTLMEEILRGNVSFRLKRVSGYR
jgi:hypothetical protein